jgi:hypothetical protein
VTWFRRSRKISHEIIIRPTPSLHNLSVAIHLNQGRREDGMERVNDGTRRAKSPPLERVSWRDRDVILLDQSETLNCTFGSSPGSVATTVRNLTAAVRNRRNEPSIPIGFSRSAGLPSSDPLLNKEGKSADKVLTGSPKWESEVVPNTPLDAEREQQYRDEAIRMLCGDSETLEVPSPLQAAASGQKLSRGGRERGNQDVYDAALKRAVDQADSEERSGKGNLIRTESGRKRVSNGYRQPTTSQALLGNVEEPLIIKRMSAESRAQAYEHRIQDLQNLLKTARKAEAQAKKTEAAAIADLEALRNESSSACRAKDADLEALRLEHETLKMTHDSLKTSMKGKRAEKEYSNISAIEKDELSALNEKLRSASSVVSALTSKVEQQRVQLFETDAKCKAAEDRAAGLKNELEKLQQEHEEMINHAKLQTAADRKHVSLAKDQIARIVAKHNSFDKAWAAKQTQLEKDLADSSRHVKELSITIQKKDQELGDLKQEILKKLWKSKSVESGMQTEKVPNKWLWLLTLKIAVMTDRDLQHEKEVQTDTVRIDGMVICFVYIFLPLQRFVALSLVLRFFRILKSMRQRSTFMLMM